MMDNKYTKLGKNTFLVFLGRAGSALIGLVMLPLYTRWLSTEGYGAADLISTYSSILLSIVTCCVADAIFIFPKNEDDEHKKKYYTSGLLFVFLTTTIICIINVFCRSLYSTKSEGFSYTYAWYTIALMASAFFQQYTQQFTRCLEKMSVFAITGIVYTIANASFSILLIPKLGLQGFLLAHIIANVLSGLFSLFFSGSFRFFNIRSFDKSHLKTLLLYGIPLIPNSIMWWMVNGVNRPIIESCLGLSALGLFAVANKFPGIIGMIAGVFSNAWGISMLDEFGKPDFSKFFNKVFNVINFLCIISSFVIIIFSKELIHLFASAEFFEAWHLLPILLVAIVLNTSSGLIGGVFMAMKQSKYFFYSSLASAVTSLVFTYLLVKNVGLIGSAIAVMLSFAVAVVLRLIFSWKHINGFKVGRYFCGIALLLLTDGILEINIVLFLKILLYLVVLGVLVLLYRDVLQDVKTATKTVIKKMRRQ